MKLVIQSPQTTLKDRTKEYIEARAAFAFSRLESSVRALYVEIHELSFAVGGKDKECNVRIQRDGELEIIMVERQASLRVAIDRALFRASYHLQRRIQRQKQMQSKSRIYQFPLNKPGGDAA